MFPYSSSNHVKVDISKAFASRVYVCVCACVCVCVVLSYRSPKSELLQEGKLKTLANTLRKTVAGFALKQKELHQEQRVELTRIAK
jgi:hypothetical protein